MFLSPALNTTTQIKQKYLNLQSIFNNQTKTTLMNNVLYKFNQIGNSLKAFIESYKFVQILKVQEFNKWQKWFISTQQQLKKYLGLLNQIQPFTNYNLLDRLQQQLLRAKKSAIDQINYWKNKCKSLQKERINFKKNPQIQTQNFRLNKIIQQKNYYIRKQKQIIQQIQSKNNQNKKTIQTNETKPDNQQYKEFLDQQYMINNKKQVGDEDQTINLNPSQQNIQDNSSISNQNQSYEEQIYQSKIKSDPLVKKPSYHSQIMDQQQ